jgi:hypothetical protein
VPRPTRNSEGSLLAGEEIINTVSERLSAPAGGLWWIAERLDQNRVVAQDNALAPIELEVVKRQKYAPDEPLATLRVPPQLPAGTRLRLGPRELVVAGPLAPLNLDDVVLRLSYRPDLGGTGAAVRVAPALRARVFIEKAYVGAVNANIQAGIQVLEELLLADAPRLCAVPLPADAGEIFVPMWAGQIEAGEDLGVLVVDADDFQNTRLHRPVP